MNNKYMEQKFLEVLVLILVIVIISLQRLGFLKLCSQKTDIGSGCVRWPLLLVSVLLVTMAVAAVMMPLILTAFAPISCLNSFK